MTNEIKKIIATAIATGVIATGASLGISKPDCDFVIQHKGEEICITTELKEAVESQLEANSGFGGVNFGK